MRRLSSRALEFPTHLFDYLEGGESLEEFLDEFPTVSRDQAVAVLSASRESLLSVLTNTQARMESMKQAVKDELFLADLNATMEDSRTLACGAEAGP